MFESFLKRYFLMGCLLVLVGTLLLLDNLNYVDLYAALVNYWPVLLIVAGLALMLHNYQDNRCKNNNIPVLESVKTISKTVADDNNLVINKFIGNVDLKLDDLEYNGGKISTFFGNIQLDLTHLKSRYKYTEFTLYGCFGNITIFTPKAISACVVGRTFIGKVRTQNRVKSGVFRMLEHKDYEYDQADCKFDIHTSTLIGTVNIFAPNKI